ncbi:cell division protein FtsQ/DivIB [Candidatus Vallotia lariciata]|uniref:cell division protein FtsQ/DivIB n=1 Tax=Candidatus Vallotia laricis TaxID=2018052 RepID=UPI001D001DD0|nr:cell division protein FtsQ/DivIB [Candidatus Vallotia lariciata]UDG82796.1 Cell division protein FtsQ [Candidatus Vallotia lariciata]
MWNNPRQLNIILNALYASLLAIVFAGGGLWLVQRPAFVLRTLLIGGDIKHISQKIVRENMLGKLDGNFFTLDLDKVRSAFEQIPWMRHASVRRVWPNILTVTLEEYKPLGVWGSNQLVSVDGEIFTAYPVDPELPMFSGPIGSVRIVVARYYDFQKWFGSLGAKLEEITLSLRYAWTIRLTNGMQIELGRDCNKDTLASRVRRLIVAWPVVTQHWGSNIKYVDLRYPNGFAIRATEMRCILDDPKAKNPQP